jgi:hypothetical protein
MRAMSSAVVLALLLSPATASSDARPWLGLEGSWATYSMSDVNAEIRSINSMIAPTTMNEIKNGFGFGATGGVDLSNGATFGLGYDRLSANSSASDPSGSITYDLPANAFRAFGDYRFPSKSQFSPVVGAAAGLVSESGSVSLSVAGVGSASGEAKGTGPVLEAFAGGDWSASPRFAVVGSLGYRYAKIGEVKGQANQVIYNPDGSKYTIDFSGFLLRLGIRVGLMP